MTASEVIDTIARIAIIDSVICTILTLVATYLLVIIVYKKTKHMKIFVSCFISCLAMIIIIPSSSAHKYFYYRNADVETTLYENFYFFDYYKDKTYLIGVDNPYDSKLLDIKYVELRDDYEIQQSTVNKICDWKKSGETKLWTKVYLKESEYNLWKKTATERDKM